MIYLVDIAQKYGWDIKPVGYNYKDAYGHGKFPTNITICNYHDNLISNIRYTNYTYIPIVDASIPLYISDGIYYNQVKSSNVISNLSSGKSVGYIQEGPNNSHMGDISYLGLEDVRLIEWGGILYGLGYRPDIIKGKVIPQLLEYNDDLTIHKSWFIDTGKIMEKNWQPIPDKPFTFIYNPETSSIITLDINKLNETADNNYSSIINGIESPEFGGTLRGSSQLIRLPDGRYVSICHGGLGYNDSGLYRHWVYEHYFVIYDGNLNILTVSPAFHFIDNCIEFCCGMCVDTRNAYISFSMYDGCSHLMTIPLDEFIRFIDEATNRSYNYISTPAYDYMIDSYKKYNIKGHVGMVYQFYLECNNRLSSADNIISDIKELQYIGDYGEQFEKNILLYFIIRKPNDGRLLNYFKEKYQSL